MTGITRGDVVVANLEPVRGSEQGGVRPCVVIQNDVSNEFSPVLIVATVTSSSPNKQRPTDVWLEPNGSGLTTRSRVMLNQIRTVDKSRLGRHLGSISVEELAEVDEAIKVSLGLVPL